MIKNIIAFIGRLAVSLLGVIFIEGLLTLGAALNYQEYGAIGWIIQSLVFAATVWFASEWHLHES